VSRTSAADKGFTIEPLCGLVIVVPSFSRARSARPRGDRLTSNFCAKWTSAKWSPGLRSPALIPWLRKNLAEWPHDFRYTIKPNGNLTINYLDTAGGPLSPLHLAFSAGLCLLFCGGDDRDAERRALRQAMIVENLQQLYTDVFNDWIVANEETAEELRWRAFAIEKYRTLRMRGSQWNFVDAFTVFRDWEEQKPDDAAQFTDSLVEADVTEFAKNPSTANLVRDLAFAYLRPEQFPTHSALVEQILYNQSGGIREREENDRVGKLMRSWSREGEKGKLFDGVGNIPIDGRVAHFELGQIPEHAADMRAAANFLVANYGRQKIISMPRSLPKIAIFEEASRTLDIPGGVRMIQEYYRQMRKFGCNILAVVQQYDAIKNSPVRGAMIGNSKIFLYLKENGAKVYACQRSLTPM